MFDLKENSEVESESGSETSRDASRGDQEAVSEDPDDMNTDGDWKVVTPRGRRHSDRSLSPVSMIKHRFVVSIGNLTRDVLVNAPAYVAKADVANAVHGQHLKTTFMYPDCYFDPKKFAHIHPNLKYIPELREYEFTINPKYVKR